MMMTGQIMMIDIDKLKCDHHKTHELYANLQIQNITEINAINNDNH